MNILQLYKSAFYPEAYTGLQRIKLLVLHALVFSFPFDIFYSNIAVITFILLVLLDYKNLNFKVLHLKTLLIQGVFWLSMFGYAYSSNYDAAGYLIERQFLIFILPLVIPISITIKPQQVTSLLFTLSGSCVIAVVYLFSNMLLNVYENYGTINFDILFSGAFFNHYFTTPIGIHAGYLSMYCVISICSLTYELITVSCWKSNVIRLKMLLLLGLGIFFLASRNSTISLLCILLFVMPFFISKSLRVLYISASAIFALAVGLSIYFTPFLQERFSNQLISDIKPLSNGSEINYNIIEPRIERWVCAWDLIVKSPVYGYGTGDEVAVLQNAYNTKGMVISSLNALNAHNTYLSITLKHGLIGLMLFLGLIITYTYWAIQARYFVYLSLLIVFWIGFYTENILDTNKGILCFAVFNTLMAYALIDTTQGPIHGLKTTT